MDPNDDTTRFWTQNQQTPGELHHQASNVSALSDFGTSPYGGAATGSPNPQLRGRESLVSVQSHFTGHGSSSLDAGYAGGLAPPTPTSSWRAAFSPTSSGGAYAPVPVVTQNPSLSSARHSHGTSYASAFRQNGIEESSENYDLSLLRTAAPMAWAPKYEAIAEDDQDIPCAFDITATMGPMTSHDEGFMRNLQEQEAKGNLTGGIGQGFRPDTTVRDAELLASPTSPTATFSKRFSTRKSRRLSRADTIRHMGQHEANRRGEVIKVIVEDDNPTAPADLSFMEGPENMSTELGRQATMASKEQVAHIFYPQPNWKPFSMRWPYLVMLILLSVALAAMQEVLFRRFRETPIVSFRSPGEVDPALYFAIKFAPTLSAVVYGVLWQFLDFEVRRLEAYYQLSKKGGALAAESINVDYVTSFNLFRPFQALKLGHYAVALSSIATTLAISLVPTFAAASVILKPSREERLKNPDAEKFVQFSETWSHLLTTTLAICAALGCALLYLLHRRRSGLLADVRGIAGLASMAVVSHILMDFKGMDIVTPKDIHRQLKHNRYTLRNSSLAPDDENPVTSKDRDRFQDDDHVSENPHPLMLRPAGCVPFLVGLLLFTGFIPAFLFTGMDAVTDKAPWLITALAVCLKLSWNAMETAVRMMEPFYILSGRHAPARTLGLDYSALPFGYLPIRALLNGHVLVFLVGFGSIMTEFLTILVTGLATVDGKNFRVGNEDDRDVKQDGNRKINSGSETIFSFYLSFGLSMFILLYMTVVAAVVFLRRRHPFLPRQPNTIASILAFIHQSKMLYDFVGTEKMSNAERMRRLSAGQKTYGLGWFMGRDGKTHCGVDEEELIEVYKHGKKFLPGNQPWNDQWDVLEYTGAG
ncbi:hypothetical protein HJFPF1_03701 [Paramyrothecium foliicola]|nr:hypothetical protein HJFPF1_03701 [Paramyrothecium foliicola]